MRLRFWEKANLLALVALVGIPTLTLIELVIIRSLHPLLPVINALVFFLVWRHFIEARKFSPRRLQFKKLLTHPLFWAFTLQLIVVITLFSAYLALPDVDPYHWIKTYNQEFTRGPLNQLPQRPLFHALVYILNQTLHIPSFIVFKNIIPLLSLTTLLPAWLVARRFPGRLKQIALLLVPSLSPSLILHAQMGTPQALLIILTVFFVFFLIYARLTHQKIWHYLAGIIMAIAIFYHGLALLIFASWLVATAWHSRHRPLGFILLLLIFFAATPYLAIYLPQIINDVRPNLSFPSSFTTIDGVPNGWPGLAGLTQYYAFYMGLSVPIILLVVFYLFISQTAYRQRFTSCLTSSAAYLTLTLCFVFFFTISEILPRLFNIAILPERAWIFAALSSTVFLVTLLFSPNQRLRWLYLVLVLAALINTTGAIYVNSLKKHLIPDYAISSARWISNNLPAASLVLSDKGPDYLDLYVSQKLRGLPRDFYCQDIGNLLDTHLSGNRPTYLYYYKNDPHDPYQDRPWRKKYPVSCPPDILEQYSSDYQKIYDDDGQAIVWKVL